MRGQWSKFKVVLGVSIVALIWIFKPYCDPEDHDHEVRLHTIPFDHDHEDGGHNIHRKNMRAVAELRYKDKEKDPPPSDPRAAVPFCTNEERLELLRAKCGKERQTLKDLNANQRWAFNWNVFVDNKHKILACLPPKSGCTTWKNILANNTFEEPLGPKFDMMSLHFGALDNFGIKMISTYNDTMQEYFIKNYYKILVARHPFERLRSAYIDKLESGKDTFMQNQIGMPILKKYHPELDPGKIKKGAGVTIDEFLKHLSETNLRNAHWDPVTWTCLPCIVSYDRILKTETLDHDNEYVILNKLGPYHRGLGTKGNTVAGGHQQASLSERGRKLDSFRGASLAGISYLEQLFKGDLDIFGYSWNYRQSEKDHQYNIYSSCVGGSVGRKCC